MITVAVTVVGEDRPGIIARVAGAVADQGGNLEDSSMTLLRGHFAMTLIAAVQAPDRLAEQLVPLEAEGLHVTISEVPQAGSPSPSHTQILSLHGSDRSGIVARTARVLADHGGNITDVSTRLRGTLYVLTAEVQFERQSDVEAARSDLIGLAEQLGVKATLSPAEEDVF